MDTLKEARDAGIEALEIFKRDVEDAQLGLINARLVRIIFIYKLYLLLACLDWLI